MTLHGIFSFQSACTRLATNVSSQSIGRLLFALVRMADVGCRIDGLLLSWLLIPVLMYKRRRALKARFETERAYRQSSQGDIIDAVVTEIKEDKI